MYKIKNWHKYQTKSRSTKNGPWLKLHRSFFADFHVRELKPEARYQLLGLFAIADADTGEIEKTEEEIAFMLGIKSIEMPMFSHFVDNTSTGCIQDVAGCLRDVDNTSPQTRLDKTRLDKTRLEIDSTKKQDVDKMSKHTSEAGFNNFWMLYPKSCPRRHGKAECKKWWNKNIKDEAESNEVILGLERASKCRQWLSDSGKFIPAPMTFLNGRRWEDDYEDGHDISESKPME